MNYDPCMLLSTFVDKFHSHFTSVFKIGDISRDTYAMTAPNRLHVFLPYKLINMIAHFSNCEIWHKAVRQFPRKRTGIKGRM